jgi:protein-disulfide isomerase
MSSLYDPTFADFLEENKKTVITIVVGVIILILGFLLFAQQTQTFFFAPNAQSDASEIIKDYSVSKGNMDSDLIFVEFFDYECSACQGFHPITKSFIEQRGKDVGFVFKYFPVIGTYSVEASRATQAAQIQGKGAEFKDEIFNRVKIQSMTVSNLTAIAKDLGLDIEKWDKDRRSTEVKDQVEKDEDLIRNLKLPKSSRGAGTKASSTPTILIMYKGKLVDWFAGALSLEDLNSITDKYLNQGKEKSTNQEATTPEENTEKSSEKTQN